MVSKIIIVIFQIIVLSFQLHPTKARTWIKAGYYSPEEMEFPISNINSSLFTHLICGFAHINSTSYNLSFSPSGQKHFSTFTDIVRKKNPSVTTLLSIRGVPSSSALSLMVNDPTSREYFINSSIETARFYGFQGLDLYWDYPATSDDMDNIDLLFKEWRAAITSEARNSARPELILTALVYYFPKVGLAANYPVGAIQQYLNWVHVRYGDYFWPDSWANFTAAPLALYNPNSTVNNADYGIRSWIEAGLSPEKMVLFLPYYGTAWTLVNPNENGIGAPARGPVQIGVAFKEIKNHINQYGAKVTFDETYVVNYFTMGTSWIAFDDVEAIQYKVSYAKKMKLLGYHVWQVSFDDHWVLSQTAAQVDDINFPAPEPEEYNRNGQNKQPHRLLEIILPITGAVILLLGFLIYKWLIKLKSKGSVNSVSVHEVRNQVNNATADAGDFSGNAPTLELYRLAYIEAATNNFASENKLGEGGYGPVYKGVLQNGQKVAVKKLSETSRQGFEEFKNEVMLTAKLQHVNLVKLLGYCIEKEEHMLIYEYML